MNVLRAIWVSAAFALLLMATTPVQVLIVLIAPSRQRHLPRFVFSTAARLMGANISVQGTPPTAGPLLITSNHVSWIDIIAIGAVVPCQFVAKRDVKSWPVFGPLARLIRTCFVDRERRHAVNPVRREMVDRFAAGDILVLFPEGTSTDGRQVLGFKSALFPGTGQAAPAVQPLTVSYCDANGRDGAHYGWYADRELLPHIWHVFEGGRFVVNLDFHPLLDDVEGQDRKEQAARSEAIVREGLALARKGAKETSTFASS